MGDVFQHLRQLIINAPSWEAMSGDTQFVKLQISTPVIEPDSLSYAWMPSTSIKIFRSALQ